MSKAGIAIDAWKLPIFEKHLKAAGYEWTQRPGLTKGVLMLYVETDRMAGLAQIVVAANTEAAAAKGKP